MCYLVSLVCLTAYASDASCASASVSALNTRRFVMHSLSVLGSVAIQSHNFSYFRIFVPQFLSVEHAELVNRAVTAEARLKILREAAPICLSSASSSDSVVVVSNSIVFILCPVDPANCCYSTWDVMLPQGSSSSAGGVTPHTLQAMSVAACVLEYLRLDRCVTRMTIGDLPSVFRSGGD